MPLLILSADDQITALTAAAKVHLCCQLLQTLMLLYACSRRWEWPLRNGCQHCFQTFIKLIKLAGPITIANLLVPLSTAYALHQLAKLESYYVSAFSLALRLESLLLVGFYAWSSVVGPIAANAIKENGNSIGKFTKRCWHLSVKHGLSLTLFAGLLTFTIEYWLTTCEASQPILQAYFLLVPLSYAGYGFLMLTTGMLNGLGHALSSLALTLLRCVIILWPTLWILASWPANTWTFMAFSLSNMGTALISLYLLSRNRTPLVYTHWQKTIQQGTPL